MGIQQGRLWSIRNSENSPIFHRVETLLPLLWKTKNEAEHYKAFLKKQYDTTVEVIEVEIIERSKEK